MNMANHRVLAIALDAAEPTLVNRLIEQGEMPAFRALLAGGRQVRVESPAHIGSGCVWPSFCTGTEPQTHGIYGEWCWQPETMSLKRYNGNTFEPFWKTLSEQGMRIGVLDPPFVVPLRPNDGFEVIEWGAHDRIGELHAHPADVADFISKLEPHPLATNHNDFVDRDSDDALEQVASSSLQGIKARGEVAEALLRKTHPDFALIVFPELHHAAHRLWGTGDSDRAHDSPINPRLNEIYCEADRQIARLVNAVDGNQTTMVFSLHGMTAGAGVTAFLQSLLCEKGFARLAEWRTQSWRERARSAMSTAKRSTPMTLKRWYYRAVTSTASWRVAQSTMLPVYDWKRTRAFSLPTDQHGWIRINLRGREAAGIVTPENYDATCQKLGAMLQNLRREDGAPLVNKTFRPAKTFEEAKTSMLPDLIVYWSDAAFAQGAGIQESEVKIRTISTHLHGQHASDGFCLLNRQNTVQDDRLQAREFSSLIKNLLLNRV